MTRRDDARAGRRYEIVLIGPQGAGKSALGRLLSEQLGLPWVEMDEVCQRYYAEVVYVPGLVWSQQESAGVHALERLLADYRECVFSLGAGHSFYEQQDTFQRAQRALSPFVNVVLLLPSPDPATSIAALQARRRVERRAHELEVTHRSNHTLATLTVYTEGRSPEQTCDEILAGVEPPPDGWP